MVFALGSKLEKIGARCFGETRIERIAIPNGVKEILDRTFASCYNLREVVFEEGSKLRTIGEDAFFCCRGLAKIDFPEGLKNIGINAFSNCDSLKHVYFPDGLEKIGVGCFSWSGLEQFVLPASVREVGAQAF